MNANEKRIVGKSACSNAKTIEDFKNAFHDAVDDDLEFHRQNR